MWVLLVVSLVYTPPVSPGTNNNASLSPLVSMQEFTSQTSCNNAGNALVNLLPNSPGNALQGGLKFSCVQK
jgi:hypothetical protein